MMIEFGRERCDQVCAVNVASSAQKESVVFNMMVCASAIV